MFKLFFVYGLLSFLRRFVRSPTATEKHISLVKPVFKAFSRGSYLLFKAFSINSYVCVIIT